MRALVKIVDYEKISDINDVFEDEGVAEEYQSYIEAWAVTTLKLLGLN